MLGTQTADQLGQLRVSRICIGFDKVKPSDFLLLQSSVGFRRLNGKEFVDFHKVLGAIQCSCIQNNDLGFK